VQACHGPDSFACPADAGACLESGFGCVRMWSGRTELPPWQVWSSGCSVCAASGLLSSAWLYTCCSPPQAKGPQRFPFLLLPPAPRPPCPQVTACGPATGRVGSPSAAPRRSLPSMPAAARAGQRQQRALPQRATVGGARAWRSPPWPTARPPWGSCQAWRAARVRWPAVGHTFTGARVLPAVRAGWGAAMEGCGGARVTRVC